MSFSALDTNTNTHTAFTSFPPVPVFIPSTHEIFPLETLVKMIAEDKITEEDNRYKITESIKLASKTTTFKVNDDGGISFYGLRKLPIILYKNELDEISRIWRDLH